MVWTTTTLALRVYQLNKDISLHWNSNQSAVVKFVNITTVKICTIQYFQLVANRYINNIPAISEVPKGCSSGLLLFLFLGNGASTTGQRNYY